MEDHESILLDQLGSWVDDVRLWMLTIEGTFIFRGFTLGYIFRKAGGSVWLILVS